MHSHQQFAAHKKWWHGRKLHSGHHQLHIVVMLVPDTGNGTSSLCAVLYEVFVASSATVWTGSHHGGGGAPESERQDWCLNRSNQLVAKTVSAKMVTSGGVCGNGVQQKLSHANTILTIERTLGILSSYLGG